MKQDNCTVSEVPEEKQTRDFLSEKLAFPRGILKLLKETRLFGPLVEKALEDIDAIAEKFQIEIETREHPDEADFEV